MLCMVIVLWMKMILRVTDVYVHKILLKEGAGPIKRRAYATSPKERDILEAQETNIWHKE